MMPSNICWYTSISNPKLQWFIQHAQASSPFMTPRNLVITAYWMVRWNSTQFQEIFYSLLTRIHALTFTTCNSLAPERWGSNFTSVFFKLILWIDILHPSCEIGVRWVSLNPIDDKSALVYVMAWCHQATSHSLASAEPYQCFHIVTRRQWVNSLRPRQNGCLFADDTFKRIFLNENIRISTENSLKFVPKGLINNIPALVLIMAWRRPGDKPLS